MRRHEKRCEIERKCANSCTLWVADMGWGMSLLKGTSTVTRKKINKYKHRSKNNLSVLHFVRPSLQIDEFESLFLRATLITKVLRFTAIIRHGSVQLCSNQQRQPFTILKMISETLQVDKNTEINDEILSCHQLFSKHFNSCDCPYCRATRWSVKCNSSERNVIWR